MAAEGIVADCALVLYLVKGHLKSEGEWEGDLVTFSIPDNHPCGRLASVCGSGPSLLQDVAVTYGVGELNYIVPLFDDTLSYCWHVHTPASSSWLVASTSAYL